MVHYRNTLPYGVTTTGTTKIYVLINQANLDNGSLNPADGTTIGAITSGASYPAGNYIPLATVTGGVITDDRVFIEKLGNFMQNQSGNYATTTGSANAYALTVFPAPTSIKAGQIFSAKANFTNSGACTLAVNGNTAKTIKKLGGTADLVSGDLPSGMVFEVIDDGTYYQLQTPVGQASSMNITGLSAVTSIADLDEFPEFNQSAGANRKVTTNTVRMAMGVYGGNGSDGAVDGTADITITGSNNTHIIKQFSSWSAGNMPSQAYTNDPASGTSIVLNMSSTTLFAIGDWVRVSSSAGADIAQVTAVSAGVSITVDNLTLNHTTSSPLVQRFRKLTITPTGCTLEIRCATNMDWTGWYVDGKGKGALGGTPNTGGQAGLGVIFNNAGGNAGVTGSSAQPTAQVAPITTTAPIFVRGLIHIAP